MNIHIYVFAPISFVEGHTFFSMWSVVMLLASLGSPIVSFVAKQKNAVTESSGFHFVNVPRP